MTRITDLPQYTVIQDSDYLVVVDTTNDATKKILKSDLFHGVSTTGDGWIAAGETWSYSSYDSTNKTGVITVPSDATTKYQPGMRVKFTESSSLVYGIITKVTATALTLYHGTDYSLSNNTISSPYYSTSKSPFGFPLDPNKWTVTVTSSVDRSTGSATYVSLTDAITVPIGVFRLELKATFGMMASDATAAFSQYVTLSSNASTETNPNLTLAMVRWIPAGSAGVVASLSSKDDVVTSTATTFTMLGKSSGHTMDVYGATYQPTLFRAVCLYL